MHNTRGIRGATTAASNTREDIHRATRELIDAIVSANQVSSEDIAAVFFTASPDLNADYPAYAFRDLNWPLVPLLCAQEIDVPGGPEKMIRILMLISTDKTQSDIKHQYLGDTQKLRPDLFQAEERRSMA